MCLKSPFCLHHYSFPMLSVYILPVRVVHISSNDCQIKSGVSQSFGGRGLHSVKLQLPAAVTHICRAALQKGTASIHT